MIAGMRISMDIQGYFISLENFIAACTVNDDFRIISRPNLRHMNIVIVISFIFFTAMISFTN